ncbi:hypothetical protein F8388_027067 [Cannabis sativa]|uniref:Uncharacterized protein n=2 Tax=Cannabis sativa TaxID=3483 RepID=A0A7J6FNW0_CANSA|nr:hypothetical protein F8388_027067 [Cannabis sativa]KAF4387817.1 hypothetical protein G4B88_004144 [Cannabis sativa]KAF4399734.1 hypothetical protein G4B88_022817 [Cannabis sativa]
MASQDISSKASEISRDVQVKADEAMKGASRAAQTVSDKTSIAAQTAANNTQTAAQSTKDSAASAIGVKHESPGFLQQTGDQISSMAQGATNAVKNTLGMGDGK